MYNPPPLGVRMYYTCPATQCGFTIAFAYTPPPPDPDLGLVMAAHIGDQHPELVNVTGKVVLLNRTWRDKLIAGLITN